MSSTYVGSLSISYVVSQKYIVFSVIIPFTIISRWLSGALSGSTTSISNIGFLSSLRSFSNSLDFGGISLVGIRILGMHSVSVLLLCWLLGASVFLFGRVLARHVIQYVKILKDTNKDTLIRI